MAAMVTAKQVQALSQAGQHAESEHVHLQHPQFVQVVLVPLDHGAPGHRRVGDRRHFVQAAAGKDHAARMLGQMTGKPGQFGGHFDGPLKPRVFRVQAQRPQPGLVGPAALAPPDAAGQRIPGRGRQPQGLAGLAQGAARAVVNDRGGQAGAFAPVAPVQVLNDFLAPLVLEVHVDVRRFAPVAGNEALEQKIDLFRVHGGNAQAKADRGIGGAAPALAQDALLSGVADQVVDGQEIRGVIQLPDQFEFVFDHPADPLRNTAGVTLLRRFPGQVLQPLLTAEAFGGLFVRIFIAQFVQAEAALLRQLDAARHGVPVTLVQPQHVARRAQMALGVGLEPEPGGIDGHALAHAHQHVGDGLALGDVHPGVGHRHHRDGPLLRPFLQPPEALGVAAVEQQRRGQRQAVGAGVGQPRQTGHFPRRAGRNGQQQLPRGMRAEFGEAEIAFTLRGPPLSQGEKAAQTAPGRAVARIADDLRSVAGLKARARQKADAGLARRGMAPHHAGNAVAIGQPDRRQPQFRGPADHFRRVGGAAQKRVIACRRQFGVSLCHAWQGLLTNA